jgi:hypothetical protein
MDGLRHQIRSVNITRCHHRALERNLLGRSRVKFFWIWSDSKLHFMCLKSPESVAGDDHSPRLEFAKGTFRTYSYFPPGTFYDRPKNMTLDRPTDLQMRYTIDQKLYPVICSWSLSSEAGGVATGAAFAYKPMFGVYGNHGVVPSYRQT